MSWIKSPDKEPSEDYLSSAPISYPMVCLTQLTNYAVVCLSLQINPDEYHDLLLSATGHSQGVVSAVVVASATTADDFKVRALDAVKYLFWHGARTQQVTPTRHLSQVLPLLCLPSVASPSRNSNKSQKISTPAYLHIDA